MEPAMTERSVVAKALEDEGTLSKEEILAVEERVQDLQAKFRAHVERERARKVNAVRFAYPNMTEAEAILAISVCNDDENQTLDRLGGPDSESLWIFIRSSAPSQQPVDIYGAQQALGSSTSESSRPQAPHSDSAGGPEKPKKRSRTIVKQSSNATKRRSHASITKVQTTGTNVDCEAPPLPNASARHPEGMGPDPGLPIIACPSSTESSAAKDSSASVFEGIAFPLELPSCNTIVLAIGRLHKIRDNDWWTIPTRSLYYHPFPVGYHAQKAVWDKLFDMFIEECPRTGKPLFRVGIKSSNKWFVGYTPTDPWTKWCLEQSRNGNSRASGPAFYGFSDKVLQHALRCLVIHTDVNEYRYRMGDSGIGDPAYSPPAVNVSEFTAEEQSTLVSRVVDLVSNGDLPISWGRVSEAFPRRPGFLCQSEYNRLGGTVVMGVAIPLSEVPIEEPYVAVDLLSKGLAKVGTGRKKNGESKASGRDKNRRSRGQESSDRRKRPRNEDSDSDDLGPVSGGSGVEAENPCAEKRDALTFSNMHLPTVCPCGYVCDYSTWLRVLAGGSTLNENILFAEDRENIPPEGPKDTCPFTKRHHTRRMLIKLTHDNWDEWRDRIRDV